MALSEETIAILGEARAERKKFPKSLDTYYVLSYEYDKYQNLILETYVNCIKEIFAIADSVITPGFSLEQIRLTYPAKRKCEHLFVDFSLENWSEHEPEPKDELWQEPIFFNSEIISSNSVVISSTDAQKKLIDKTKELKIEKHFMSNLQKYIQANCTNEIFQIASCSRVSITINRKSSIFSNDTPENLKERYMENRQKILEPYADDIIKVFRLSAEVKGTEYLLRQLYFVVDEYTNHVCLMVSFEKTTSIRAKFYNAETAFANLVTGTPDSKRNIIEKLDHLKNIPSCILCDLAKYFKKDEMQEFFEVSYHDNKYLPISLTIEFKDE